MVNLARTKARLATISTGGYYPLDRPRVSRVPGSAVDRGHQRPHSCASDSPTPPLNPSKIEQGLLALFVLPALLPSRARVTFLILLVLHTLGDILAVCAAPAGGHGLRPLGILSIFFLLLLPSALRGGSLLPFLYCVHCTCLHVLFLQALPFAILKGLHPGTTIWPVYLLLFGWWGGPFS